MVTKHNDPNLVLIESANAIETDFSAVKSGQFCVFTRVFYENAWIGVAAGDSIVFTPVAKAARLTTNLQHRRQRRQLLPSDSPVMRKRSLCNRLSAATDLKSYRKRRTPDALQYRAHPDSDRRSRISSARAHVAITPILLLDFFTRRTCRLMFRPDNPLLENWQNWPPVGYHGRFERRHFGNGSHALKVRNCSTRAPRNYSPPNPPSPEVSSVKAMTA